MTPRYKPILNWIALFLVLLSVGCGHSELTPAHTIMTSLSTTEAPFVTAVTSKSSSTVNLTPITTSTPSATLTSTPVFTRTLLPTLTSEEAITLVHDLLTNNGDCLLPCWWGITPGESSWDQAYEFLSTFTTQIEQWYSRTVTENGVQYPSNAYGVLYNIGGEPRGGGANFRVTDGTIRIIYVGSSSTGFSFQLNQLLTNYGMPGQVLVRTFSNSPDPDFYLPFALVLFYPEQRFMAYYDLEAEKVDGSLEACPQQIGPALWLWASEEIWTDERVQSEVLGYDPSRYLVPIEEVTELDIETFYQTFREPDSPACIRTPIELWP